MIVKAISTLSILFFATILLSQTSNIIFKNSTVYDENRYNGIKGSAYTFDHWLKGSIIDSGVEYQDLELNYNAYKQEMEVRKDDKFIILDITCTGIIISKQENQENWDKKWPDEMRFLLSTRKKEKDTYDQILYSGQKLQFIKIHRTTLTDRTINDYGKNRTIKSFQDRSHYILIHNGKETILKLKEKEFLKVLGKKDQLKQFLKSQNNKLKSEKEVIDMLTYYESL